MNTIDYCKALVYQELCHRCHHPISMDESYTRENEVFLLRNLQCCRCCSGTPWWQKTTQTGRTEE